VLYSFAPDPVTAFTRVATGEADVFEAVRPDKVAEVRANPQLRLVVGPMLDYSFLGFNLRDADDRAAHPIFGDRNVRRALTMATDRRSIVANIFDTLAVQARGPFTAANASSDPSLKPLPYAVDSANALLDAAGWVRGADSMRSKNGTPLAFAMLTPSSSAARMRAAVLLQEQFRRVGVNATVDAVDFPTFIERSGKRRYETLVNQWSPDPGIGSVNGLLFGAEKSRAVVLSYDATVLAGTQGKRNHQKTDRMLGIALANKLPVVIEDTFNTVIDGPRQPLFGRMVKHLGSLTQVLHVSGAGHNGSMADTPVAI
jgi:peptide/nickel transport system substrate-binding protein